jgi:outer membrane protein OmpA-like peptidoglycan-associated protein
VVAWLSGRGIDGARLTAVGRGESEPVADNATPDGRQENRRVVIRKAD